MAKRGDRIRRRSDGRWEGRIKVGTYQNGKTKYKSLYGKSYKDVREKMEHFNPISLFEEKTYFSTLNDVISYWLKNSNINRKGSTVHKYEYLIENHILPTIGNVRVEQFSSELFNSFLTEKMKKGRLDGKGGLSQSYVKTMAIIIQSSIDFCVKDKKCSSMYLSINKPIIPKKEIQILSKECQSILESEVFFDVDLVKLGVMISLQTGLRIGEICALSWDDIDFQNDIIHIRHTVSRVRCDEKDVSTHLIIDTPKTEASVRDVPLPSVIKPYLSEKYHKRISNYVVSDKPGFISPRTFEYRYHKLLQKCNIPSINYHALRHTFATRCVEVGMDIKTLSEILGHADVAITLKTYVHSSMEIKRIQIEKLASISD